VAQISCLLATGGVYMQVTAHEAAGSAWMECLTFPAYGFDVCDTPRMETEDGAFWIVMAQKTAAAPTYEQVMQAMPLLVAAAAERDVAENVASKCSVWTSCCDTKEQADSCHTTDDEGSDWGETSSEF